MRVLTALGLGLALLALTPPSTVSALEKESARKRQAASYFPLELGNWWVYTSSAWWIPLREVSVKDRVTAPNGLDYFVLDGYLFGERQVRVLRSDVVSELDPAGGRDFLWYMLGAPVGTTWDFQMAPRPYPCVNGVSVTVASRTDVVRVPAGEFRNVVRLERRPVCCDCGITAEWFAPGVGLIRRRETSSFGSELTELVDARVGGVVVRQTRYETSLSVDSPLYGYGPDLFPPLQDPFPTLKALFVLRNETDIPLQLSFPGCKSVTFSVLNADGVELQTAKGFHHTCSDSTGPLDFTLAGGSLVIGGSFRLVPRLPDGRYTLVATLDTVDPLPLRPSARAVFDVTTTQ